MLAVDREFGAGVARRLSADGRELRASFEAEEPRRLRASANAFLLALQLVAETAEAFGRAP